VRALFSRTRELLPWNWSRPDRVARRRWRWQRRRRRFYKVAGHPFTTIHCTVHRRGPHVCPHAHIISNRFTAHRSPVHHDGQVRSSVGVGGYRRRGSGGRTDSAVRWTATAERRRRRRVLDRSDRVLQEAAGGHRVPGITHGPRHEVDARHGRRTGPQRSGNRGRGRGRRRQSGPTDRRFHHVRHFQLLPRRWWRWRNLGTFHQRITCQRPERPRRRWVVSFIIRRTLQ